MSFLYPTILYSLFVLTIPIIIHLFNFRRYKTVYFSNILFLKNINQDTKSKSKLKYLLILLSRLLFFIFLIFAFAQPFIPNKNLIKKDVKSVAIYIDNSFSMELEGDKGKLLDIAKNNAIDIANTFSNSTKFLLLSNDFQPKNQHLVSKEQFIKNISEIQSTPTVQKSSDIINKFKVKSSDYNIDSYYYISDFQISSTDLNNIKIDTTSNYFFIKLNSQNINNISIDSCWFENPEHIYLSNEEITVKIKNSSSESFQNIPIKIYINDTLKALNTFNIDDKSDIEIKLQYTNTNTGHINGKIEITDYPITFDNLLYFSYFIDDNISTLLLYQDIPNKYFLSLLSDSLNKFTYSNISKTNYSTFQNYNVIILDNINELSTGLIFELEKFCKSGGNLIVIPSMKINETYNNLSSSLNLAQFNYTDTSNTEIKTINSQSNIFKNVIKKIDNNTIMPKLFNRYIFSNPTENSEILLETKDKKPALIKSPYFLGNIYQFAFNLENENSNFATHPLFVPTILNVINYSFNNSKIYDIIGTNIYREIQKVKSSKNSIIKIKNRITDYEFIPNYSFKNNYLSIQINNDINQDGNYLINNNDTSISNISLNYNRLESNLQSYSIDEIDSQIKMYDLTNINIVNDSDKKFNLNLNEANTGKPLWELFLLLSFLFIIIEILLIKFLK